MLPSTPYQTFLSLPKCFTTEQSTVEASFLLYDKESNNFPYLDADKRYFRRKFTSSVEEPTYSYRSTTRIVRILSRWLAGKIFFWPISEEVQPGDSVAFLHQALFFFESSYNRKILVESFRRKDETKDEFIIIHNITCKIKAWKKFRPERDSNPSPLRCRWQAIKKSGS